MREVHIYTDGACDTHNENKPGGWAAILIDVKTGTEKEITGKALHTTNNEMEITAALEGLKALKGTFLDVTVFTDSQYLIGVMNGWKRRKNQELLSQLDYQVKRLWFAVKFEHVRGHSGDECNSRADKLAVRARNMALSEVERLP